jgi:7-carboxy-7-deazaguanine synthase
MRLAEMFMGFDGEVNFFGQGTPSVFIRFAGCNLRCFYCDTKQWNSLQSGESVSVLEVLNRVKGYEKRYLSEAKFKKVTITGGEPLLQYFEFWKLVETLGEEDWNISVETNGSMPLVCPLNLNNIQAYVDSWVVDYKLPSSGMEEYMMPIESFKNLSGRDFIKFVIQNENDLKFAFEIQRTIQDNTDCGARFAYSPCWGKFDIKDLADALLRSDSEILGNCIINYQLHKLWLDPSGTLEIKN